MIEEDGSVSPDAEEINLSVDEQFKIEAAKNNWTKCGLCDYYGDPTMMEFHKRGQHGR